MRIRLSLIALTVLMGVIVSSCKEKPAPAKTDEQLQTEKLVGTWVLDAGANVVTLDGNDVSADWTSFTLTLGDKTYQTTNAAFAEVWPASGTWAYGADVSKMVRDDGVEISIAVTEDTSLQMQFDYTDAGGRLNGIAGNWIFKLVP